MGRYIVLYEAPLGVAERFAQATPEEAIAGMQLSVDCAQKIGPGLVDPGRPLANAHRVSTRSVASTRAALSGCRFCLRSPWTTPWRWSGIITICTGQRTAK